MKKLNVLMIVVVSLPLLIAVLLGIGMANGNFIQDDTKVIAMVVCVFISYALGRLFLWKY